MEQMEQAGTSRDKVEQVGTNGTVYVYVYVYVTVFVYVSVYVSVTVLFRLPADRAKKT